jgi:hypothetical protein
MRFIVSKSSAIGRNNAKPAAKRKTDKYDFCQESLGFCRRDAATIPER